MFNEAFFADVAGCEMHPLVVPVAWLSGRVHLKKVLSAP
jgi:hypothetical protein